MGTLVGVTLRGDDARVLEGWIREVFAEIERLEAVLSEWRPDSAVSQVNAAAGVNPVQVPSEVIEVLAVAAHVARATHGAFDATWAALADLWRVDAPDFRKPPVSKVKELLLYVNQQDVVVDAPQQTVFLRQRGMRLGLGGIAKAYIAERAADLAIAHGALHVLIDAGGDLVARGRRGSRPWTVGVRHPDSAAVLLAKVELHDESVATSGDYERCATVAGRRYHHLLDPRTGFPARVSRSATVVAPQGALADALATGIFVLGMPGLAVVPAFPGTAALLVTADGETHVSAGGHTRFRTKRQEP